MARTRAQDYEAKRQEILRQASKLFAEHGYAATSITMIAEASGLGRSLLYYYYPDKDAVAFDILAKNLNDQLAAAKKVRGTLEDPKENFLAVIVAMLEFSQYNDEERRVRMRTLQLLPDDKREQLQNIERKLIDILSNSIAAAVPSVGKGPLLKALTMSVFSMLNWHFRWFREGQGLTRQEYAHMVAQIVLVGAPVVAEDLPARTLPAATPKSRKRPQV